MSDAVIQTQDLTKRFRGKPAVDRLTLSVPRGAIFALLGDNGAGKTTTIRMLTGLLPSDAGKAIVLRRDAWHDAAALRRQVGYVPEKPRFYDWMTVSEIGWFTAGFHGPGFRPRFVELTTKFQLDPSARLRHLSKGEYAKVALALALAPDPELLILDEPTSGLDLLVRREFLARMVGLAGEGRTILISSHQIAEVERVASHVAFLAKGRPLLTATMEELRQRIVRLRLRYETEPPDPAHLGTVLQRNGTGRLWQAIIQDPNRSAVENLRSATGIHDFEEAPLGLEEVYCALLERKEGAK
jgi:ABC-2 type transport system ATP-binding protein